MKKRQFLIPTCEEITARLSGNQYFTVIDMKDVTFKFH